MTVPEHASVLICGAGPSGLIMAAQLLRYGIRPVIIDSKTAPASQSRALGVQARSLEIFQQMGLDQTAITEGNIVSGFALHHGAEEIGRISLEDIGGGKTAFPYLLILEQSKTERVLLDYLTANTCPVFWNTELSEVQPFEDGIRIKIKHEDEIREITCNWLIGADGAHSKVREGLNINFSGGTYHHQFYLADLILNQQVDSTAVRVFYQERSFAALFPMSGQVFRFIGGLPEKFKDRNELSFEDIRPYLNAALDFPLDTQHCNWFAVYRLHHRMASRFNTQRCFLIGDAAHIHSPVGGQGMNTGLQDAYNLAWKLAGVIDKRFDLKILETYAEERMPVARKLLNTTDRVFTFIVSQNLLVRKFRNLLLPFLIKRISRSKEIGGKVFYMISQTGINYRKSSLSVHHSQAKKIKAGDRLPYIKLYDEKLKQETNLHNWCKNTGFTLIAIGRLTPRDIPALANWIKLNYPFNLNFYYLPYSKTNQHVFDRFEIGENQKKAIIVRPDLHVGYISDTVDTELIGGYFKSIGWVK